MIFGCGQPLPDDKLDYVGYWEGGDITLLITPDGGVVHTRQKDNVETQIDAPIQEFEDDHFTVGLLFFTTTFQVDEPPHRVGKEWKMILDGVELIRKPRPVIPNRTAD